jgi:pimeloyl-ACP methyl ester carboxylesterase
MSMPAVYFSHGQESGPWGTKIKAMAATVEELGCRVESIDYRGIKDPARRVAKLITEAGRAGEPIVLVGSSMGGHVATAAAPAVRAVGLFLLAPAFYIKEMPGGTPPAPAVPIAIVHGWRDDVVPVENSIRYAQNCRATLHVVDGDHRLTENIEDINVWLRQLVRASAREGAG